MPSSSFGGSGAHFQILGPNGEVLFEGIAEEVEMHQDVEEISTWDGLFAAMPVQLNYTVRMNQITNLYIERLQQAMQASMRPVVIQTPRRDPPEERLFPPRFLRRAAERITALTQRQAEELYEQSMSLIPVTDEFRRETMATIEGDAADAEFSSIQGVGIDWTGMDELADYVQPHPAWEDFRRRFYGRVEIEGEEDYHPSDIELSGDYYTEGRGWEYQTSGDSMRHGATEEPFMLEDLMRESAEIDAQLEDVQRRRREAQSGQ